MQEMGKAMTDNCTVVRHNDRLEKTLAQCGEWKARYRNVRLSDTGMWTNQNLSFARATGGLWHVKTAGTSYLEAVREISRVLKDDGVVIFNAGGAMM